MAEQITSTSNALVKRIRKLEARKYRDREGRAFVQGIQAVRQCVEAGTRPELILLAPDLVKADSVHEFANQCAADGIDIVPVSAPVFASLVDTSRPSGLGALIPISRRHLDDLTPPAGEVSVIALDRAANPGNLGTILRTANATGTHALILIGPSADPYDPQALKAAMGATFSTPVHYADTLDQFAQWCRRTHLTTLAASGAAPETVWDLPWPPRVALVMGSEQHGLPSHFLAQADHSVRLPMTGTAESLNLAIASGVLLYENVRRRRQH